MPARPTTRLRVKASWPKGAAVDDVTKEQVLFRHSLLVRVTHWINAVAFVFLVVSGAGIVVAHPEFYWGETGYYGDETFIKLGIAPDFSQAMWARNFHFLFAWVF